MLVKCIEGFHTVFGAPANWTKETMGVCGGLPVKRVDTHAGPMWVSAWEPTPEELVLLNAGGSIHLFVGANIHPVVAMSVNPLEED